MAREFLRNLILAKLNERVVCLKLWLRTLITV